MKRLKTTIGVAGMLLFILAAAFLFLGLKGLPTVLPASDYEDMGTQTFSPYRVTPIQVKNTATGRNKRLKPTKTAYMVCYRALVDGTAYEWKVNAGSTKDKAQQIQSAGNVERRILKVKESGNVVTTEPEQTAESYTNRQKQRYVFMVGLSAAYLAIYLAAWVILLKRRKI